MASLEFIKPNHRRILIAGVPRAGKTTISEQIAAKQNLPLYHTDDLIESYDWAEQSEAVAALILSYDEYIIEGITVPRGIRKILPAPIPSDLIIWLPTPILTLTPGQTQMTKATHTIFNEVSPFIDFKALSIQL